MFPGHHHPSSVPVVTAAVVTYNSGKVVGDCVRSLASAFADVPYEVVIADNASSDDSIAAAREADPTARTVLLDGNCGYAAGVNAAVRASRATEAIYVLNPDVRLAPRSVGPLLDSLRRGRAGIAVPRLQTESGQLLYSLRNEPSIVRALSEAVLGGHRAARTGGLSEVIGRPEAYRSATTADWASGAAMLISLECWRAVGEWDESFFLYSEETEYALRARDLGYPVRYEPGSVAIHLGGEQSVDPRLWSMAVANRIGLFRRRHQRLPSLMFQGAVILNEGLRAARGSPVHRAGLRAAVRGRATP